MQDKKGYDDAIDFSKPNGTISTNCNNMPRGGKGSSGRGRGKGASHRGRGPRDTAPRDDDDAEARAVHERSGDEDENDTIDGDNGAFPLSLAMWVRESGSDGWV